MEVHKEGSLVVLMLGLFWLAGIITVLLYGMVAHISTLVALREVQMQYWHLIEGGMRTAVSALNDAPDLYLQEQSHTLLYEGPWQIDPRHQNLFLNLSYEKKDGKKQGVLEGNLRDNALSLIRLRWQVAYDEPHKKWHVVGGERIFDT